MRIMPVATEYVCDLNDEFPGVAMRELELMYSQHYYSRKFYVPRMQALIDELQSIERYITWAMFLNDGRSRSEGIISVCLTPAKTISYVRKPGAVSASAKLAISTIVFDGTIDSTSQDKRLASVVQGPYSVVGAEETQYGKWHIRCWFARNLGVHQALSCCLSMLS